MRALRIARRVGIALGSFVIAWFAVSLLAGWFFGSGNILVWVLAGGIRADRLGDDTLWT